MIENNKLSLHVKNKENPFIEKAIDEINNHIVKKYKTASKTDQRATLQAIDPKTGEMIGHTQFIRQIEVDEQQFAKVYLAQFSAFFDLKTQAIKVFGYILTIMKPKYDWILFNMEDCMNHTEYKTKKPIYQGLTNLINSEIIARGPADNVYFINPLVVFNGDRVSYVKTYVKKKKAENPNQLGLFGEKTKNFDVAG